MNKFLSILAALIIMFSLTAGAGDFAYAGAAVCSEGTSSEIPVTPTTQSVTVGKSAAAIKLDLTATEREALSKAGATLQWQRGMKPPRPKEGETLSYSNISGATGMTLTSAQIGTSTEAKTVYFRCIINVRTESKASAAATVKFVMPENTVKITGILPLTQTVEVDKLPQDITVTATGDGLKYRWYISTDGTDFSLVKDANTAVFSGRDVPGDAHVVGKSVYIYCYVTDAYNNEIDSEVVSVHFVAAAHTHSAGSEWKYSKTEHWRECSCGYKMNVYEHIFGEWKQTKAATETAEGEKERVCLDCGYKETVSVPASGHTHSAGSDWKSDVAEHWNECSCGEKMNAAVHTWGDWVETKAATADDEGTRERVCSVCGYREVTVIPVLGHTHSAGSEWKTDNDRHWHECSCGEKINAAAHTYGDWIESKAATATEEGIKERFCSACGYRDAEAVPKTDVQTSSEPTVKDAGIGTWKLGETGNYQITAEGKTFKGVRIDGTELSDNEYSSGTGGVIKLASSYLNTLKPGVHNIDIVFENGNASVKLEVVEGEQGVNIIIVAAIAAGTVLIITAVITTVIIVNSRKKKN